MSADAALLDDMVLAAAYVVMALGLNIVVGFAGLLDLGYVAFVAIGAYTAAYFASGFWADAGPDGQGVAILVSGPVSQLAGIHVNFLLVFVLAVAATTVAGALIGVPTLRLRGDYVAIVTLAFGEIIGQVAANGGDIALFGGTLTAGPNNIGPIDKIDLPFLTPFDALDPRPWYWFALGLVALALVVTVRLRDSRIGRAWTALRDDEGAAAAAGIPIARTKLVAYAIGAAFGGVAGAFLASYFSAVNAAQFQFSFSLFVFSMVVLGGAGLDSRRRGRRHRPLGGQQLSPARRARFAAAQGRPRLRLLGDRVRRLRRHHRDRDAAAAQRTLARTGGGRRRRIDARGRT